MLSARKGQKNRRPCLNPMLASWPSPRQPGAEGPGQGPLPPAGTADWAASRVSSSPLWGRRGSVLGSPSHPKKKNVV